MLYLLQIVLYIKRKGTLSRFHRIQNSIRLNTEEAYGKTVSENGIFIQ